jgi:AraC-like DNA-binding protein
MSRQTPVIAHPVTPTLLGGGAAVLVGSFGAADFCSLFENLVTQYRMDFVDDRAQLLTVAIARRPVAVLLPVRDLAGTICAPLATRLCAEVPDTRVITLWHPEHDRISLAEVIRSGSETFAATCAADVARCIAGLHESGRLSMADVDALRSLLGDVQPKWLAEILLAAVRWAHRGLSVSDFSNVVGCSRRTLGRHSRQAGWPAPEELIEWGRLLRASLIQWREQSSLVALAHASGFAGPQALHRSVNRLLGEATVIPAALTPLRVTTAFRRRLTQ